MAKKTIKKVTTVTEEIIEENVNEKTHIICILDTSGSMSTIISDSIGGFNTFLKKQKELPDDATISVSLFNDQYEKVYENIPIKEAEELTDKVWIPRGMTALYDAIGKSIGDARASFAKLSEDEKPSKVLVCIVTDGLENSSREYKKDNIVELIKDCEEDNWNFIYLAANQDAFNVGTSFGVSAGNTFTYTADSVGVGVMNATLTNAATTYRSTYSSSDTFDRISKNLISSEDENE